MFRIVHTADWHWEADKIDKCQDSANFIINKLRELKPDLHVIAGDYWNRRQTLTKLSAVIPALETMRQLADISPVILIYGNEAHDAAGSYEIFRNLDTKFPIYVADRAETIDLMFDSEHGTWFQGHSDKSGRPEAILHLFPYPTKQWFLAGKENLSIDGSNNLIREALGKIFTGFGAITESVDCPVIFVGHCNIAGALLSSGQTLLGQDIMISKPFLELARADYYALGHIHKRQNFGDRIWYSGSTYHCNFGEVEKKSFNLVEFDTAAGGSLKNEPVVSQIEIPSRPLSLHELTWVPADETWDDPSCNTQDWLNAELRVRVNVTREQQLRITDDDIKSRIYPGAYSYQIERIIIPEERVRSSEIVKAKTLPEKVFEWGASIQKEIPADVLTLAGDVEGSVTL
jgi:DNA repair exonuclease SbcCD nuclease subunit